MTAGRLRCSAALLLAGVVLAACARTAGPSTDAGPAPATDPPAATARPSPAPAGSDLPAVDVVELASGATVALASIAPSERPTLVWFWAPT